MHVVFLEHYTKLKLSHVQLPLPLFCRLDHKFKVHLSQAHGERYARGLHQISAWLVYGTFLVMHIQGLAPRHIGRTGGVNALLASSIHLLTIKCIEKCIGTQNMMKKEVIILEGMNV
jgi:hypothetical protein